MEKLTLEQIDHELKALELKEKQLTFDRNIELRYEEKLAHQKLSVLQELRYLLTSTKIDESKSFIGGESVYKNLLTEDEEAKIKLKILTIINSI
jgi:Spy/CpxP family protein refolding chaperone